MRSDFQTKILKALLLLPLLLSSGKSFAQGYDFVYHDYAAPASNLVDHGFTFNLYRNCNPVPGSFQTGPVAYTLDNGSPVYDTYSWNPIVSFGNPFCSSVTAACTSTGPLNYQNAEVKFTFTPKANIAAPGLHTLQTKFGVTGFGNFEAANMGGTYAIEPIALNKVSAGMINRAPKFINPPVIFANVNQLISYSTAAIDMDGDSLVYNLQSLGPWAGYAPGFTYLDPITASPALSLNSRTGNITFKPTAYNATAGLGATENKYMVGLEVEEYRKISGQMTLIGTIQRCIMVNVFSDPNNTPALTATRNGSIIAPNTYIDVNPGATITLDFSASDLDASNIISLVSNIQNIISQATFTSTPGQSPNSGQISWTPTSADVRDEPYYFNVSAIDGACPYPGTFTNTYGIRVRNITGITSDCFGAASFQVYPNPFTVKVNFRISSVTKAESIFIYNLLGQQIDEIAIPKTASAEHSITWENAGKHAAGTYVAKLITESKTIQTLKFTKLQ
ncbi:T9SS type A sorting domain-containing protein [Adhaeribacter sp. BT258]|uniref:T9SS type A sorting domain-containing protein n=1 Tax=Adhaeribacter terrigena TaxID=2793070 RepID=A0ABS1C3L3_9BACT|nr:T9SS type A sorting domain-containing protein [Adhaeribacter terrigena]MBK0403990.1 T9SS type A sorting domain-containing protein [Adhaeribacter terrigena]